MFSYNEIQKTLSVDKIPVLLGIPFEYIKLLIEDYEEYGFTNCKDNYDDYDNYEDFFDDYYHLQYHDPSKNVSELMDKIYTYIPDSCPSLWYEKGVSLEELMIIIEFVRYNLKIDSSSYELLKVENVFQLETRLKEMLDMAVFIHKYNNQASLEL